jgi:hypothetical protein
MTIPPQRKGKYLDFMVVKNPELLPIIGKEDLKNKWGHG